MLHVLSTVWSISPMWVIVFLAMCVTLAFLAVVIMVGVTAPKIPTEAIDDYPYRKQPTLTLIDTRAEWSYQPQTVNLRGK